MVEADSDEGGNAVESRLYIVSGKKTREAAEALERFIDAGDSPLAGERTELWTVRDYLKGAEGLSAADYLVFLGVADAWAEETAGGGAAFDRLGMRCVTKGRRALLTAAEGPVMRRKEKRELLDFLRGLPELGEGELALLESERKIALLDSLRAAVNPFGMVLEQQIAPPPGSADLTDTERAQYKALCAVFAREILPAWTGE